MEFPIISIFIFLGPKDLEAKIGSTVVMSCNVSWDPLYDLKVVWRRENMEIEADDERIINGNNSLTIKNVNPADKGKFIQGYMYQVVMMKTFNVLCFIKRL